MVESVDRLRAELARYEPFSGISVGAISRDQGALEAWLDEWVHGLSGRAEYVEKMGPAVWQRLEPGEAWSGQVNYGLYR